MNRNDQPGNEEDLDARSPYQSTRNSPGIMENASRLLDRMLRIEVRHQELESDIHALDLKVTRSAEKYNTLEKLMGAELRRIGDEVTRIGTAMGIMADKIHSLSERRNGDLRTILGVTWSILITVLGALGWWIFTQLATGALKP